MMGIQSKDISKLWDGIETAILKGDTKADFLRMYPLAYVKEQLQLANWQCWFAEKTIFLTQIGIYPSGYKEFIILLVTGKGMDEWNERAWSTLKGFADYQGCDEIKFMGRKGWSRYGKRHEPDIKTEYRYKVIL